tara:strand:- start:211 stop:534 length:324 start_codon:yes stop_codon:yes gene_type:complete
MTKVQRTQSRIHTRLIAYLAILISSLNFSGSLLVYVYMKSPAFENQLLGQVMKNMDWIVADEVEKQIRKLKPRPVPDPNDPNKWFWDLIEKRNQEYIEWETKGKWEN